MVGTPINHGVWELITGAGFLVKLVLLLLGSASVLCWAIIFLKWRVLKRTDLENERFLDGFWKSKNLDEANERAAKCSASTLAHIFQSGFKELQKLGQLQKSPETARLEIENVHRALGRSSQQQVSGLERHVSWLATTASAAPFVGLFGTVWGIMNSFRNIGATGSANLAVVAPGISEALIATAVGLAAAIPAAIAYNHFVQLIRKQSVDMECFSQDFLNIISRGLANGGTQ